MKKFTFRTEMDADNERVPLLLEELGICEWKSYEAHDKQFPDYKMGIFTFPSPYALENIRSLMESLIETDERFVDMHRCYQTLAQDDKPDKDWFKAEVNKFLQDNGCLSDEPL